ATDHLHLDTADLHRRLRARLWIASGVILDVENPLLVLPVGLLRLAQALPRLRQRYHVGSLLRIGFLLEFLLKLPQPPLDSIGIGPGQSAGRGGEVEIEGAGERRMIPGPRLATCG